MIKLYIMGTSLKNGKTLLRSWIIVNYLTLLIIVAVFMLDHLHNWHAFLIPIELISGSLFIWSFYRGYWITGSWKLVHASLKDADKEQIIAFLPVIRLSYQLFTIILSLILLVIALAKVPMNVVLVASIIYFAHILPASIHIWVRSK